MDELKIKRNRIYHLLENNELEGLILIKNSNIAWLTDGIGNK